MMDYDRLAASTPINRLAAQQTGPGNTWNPKVKLQDWYEQIPPMKSVAKFLHDPGFTDFTGVTVGRLTVLGLWDKGEAQTPASWVCRCKCGYFCSRTSKSLRVGVRGGNSFVPMCGRCDYQRLLAAGYQFKSLGESA